MHKGLFTSLALTLAIVTETKTKIIRERIQQTTHDSRELTDLLHCC